jgi:hypothetical protein
MKDLFGKTWLSFREIATIMQFSLNTVHGYKKENKLQARKIGNAYYATIEDVLLTFGITQEEFEIERKKYAINYNKKICQPSIPKVNK